MDIRQRRAELQEKLIAEVSSDTSALSLTELQRKKDSIESRLKEMADLDTAARYNQKRAADLEALVQRLDEKSKSDMVNGQTEKRRNAIIICVLVTVLGGLLAAALLLIK